MTTKAKIRLPTAIHLEHSKNPTPTSMSISTSSTSSSNSNTEKSNDTIVIADPNIRSGTPAPESEPASRSSLSSFRKVNSAKGMGKDGYEHTKRPSFYSDFSSVLNPEVVSALMEYDNDLSNMALSASALSVSAPTDSDVDSDVDSNVLIGGAHHQTEAANFKSNHSSSIVFVDREDLQRISLLGQGHFCNVHLVCGSLPQQTQLVREEEEENQAEQEQSDRNKNHKSPSVKKSLYASKAIDPARICSAEEMIFAASDLANEAKTLSELNHENIIKLHALCSEPFSKSFDSYNADVGQSSIGPRDNNGLEGFFLVLEALTDTLSDRLTYWRKEEQELNRKSRRFSLSKFTRAGSNKALKLKSDKTAMYERTQDAIIGIAKGMEYLHSRNIAWRDLKPGNIGFDEAGNVRLFDFGMARRNVSDCDPKEICGSPKYMAPEIMFGKGYSLKVDVYSFGVLLFEMCSLQVPFAAYYANKNQKKNRKNTKSDKSKMHSSKKSNGTRFSFVQGKKDEAPEQLQTAVVEDFYECVIQTGMKPSEDLEAMIPCSKICALIEDCWQTDPTKRPPFEEILPTLNNIYDGGRKKLDISCKTI